ncbi:MAG: sugar ABC transporter permease [Myxococcaceae bacterium]|nr:sugar ABC transporter permease [Myxococcaceae bacterium]
MFRHAFLICFTLAVLWPILWVLKIAFNEGQDFSISMNPLPDKFTLQNFVHLVSTTDKDGNWLFGRQFLNSLVISASASLIGIFVSASAAYAFSRFKFPGRRAGMMAFLITQMFPGTMMMIPLYLLLNYLGLLDSMLGLILVYSTSTIPFCTWNLKGYFDTIPHELEEAAIIDGASQARIFWQIIMPLSAPALAVTALIAFMSSWNEYIMAAKFMDSELSYTLPVVVNSYISSKSVQWGYFAAGAVLVSTPIVLLFLALQKFMVGGLTAGGVKG